MNISINKSEVKGYGDKILDYSAEFNDDIKKLLNIIESINEIWNGSDSLKYINVMKEKYITGLDEIRSVISEFGEYLQKVPDVYASIDEVFSSKNITV